MKATLSQFGQLPTTKRITKMFMHDTSAMEIGKENKMNKTLTITGTAIIQINNSFFLTT